MINKPGVSFSLYDHNKILEWINCYPQAQMWVRKTLGQDHYGFMSYDDLKKHFKTEFKTNDRLKKFINDIYDKVSNNKITRIEGQAGAGKTRCIVEAFNRTDKEKEAAIKQSAIIYVQNSDNYKEERLLSNIDNFITEDKKVIIIADNCSYSLYSDICDKLKFRNNSITFISIDYECSNDKTDENIVTFPIVDDDVIKDILRNIRKKELPEIEFLVNICGGNPKMAELLSPSRPSDLGFSGIIPKDILDKMQNGRREPDEAKTEVLRVLSLFYAIKYDDTDEKQLYEIAKIAGITSDDCLEKFNELKDKHQLIQSRYEYHSVIPKVLAYYMILNWVNNTTTISIREKLSNLPDIMKENLFKQIKNLNNHPNYPKIKDIAEDLCRPFANAEILNTDFGAKCFRILSEIAPECALTEIEKTFKDYNKEQFLNVKNGRRGILNALQIIAFHKDLFIRAARIILNLAEAENESWGNNATGEFKNFYKIMLSGTECPAITRLTLIKEIMSGNNITQKQICLDALDNGLNINYFSRIKGYEKQGVKRLVDWKPSNSTEVQEYLSEIINILETCIIKNDGELSLKAKDILGSKISILVTRGFSNIIEEPLNRIIENQGNNWPSARKAVYSLLYGIKQSETSDESKIPDEIKNRVFNFKNLLEPDNIEDEIKFKLIQMENWHLDKDEKDTIGEKLAKKIRKNDDVIIKMLPELLQSTNCSLLLFGQAIVNALPEDSIKSIIDKSIDILKKSQTEIKSSADAIFLSGILKGLHNKNESLANNYLDRFSKQKETASRVILISKYLPDSKQLFCRITKIVKEQSIPEFIISCIGFTTDEKYKGAFKDLVKLIRALFEKKTNASLCKIVEMLFYAMKEDHTKLPEELYSVAKSIIFDFNAIRIIKSDNAGIPHFEYSDIFNYLFKEQKIEEQLLTIKKLLYEILNDHKDSTMIKETGADIVKDLLTAGNTDAFKALMEVTAESDSNASTLSSVFEPMFHKNESLIANISIENLKNAALSNERNALFLSKIIPVFDKNKESALSEYFIMFANEFYNKDEILSSLCGKAFEFFCWGEPSFHYDKILKAFQSFPFSDKPELKAWTERIKKTAEKEKYSSDESSYLRKSEID